MKIVNRIQIRRFKSLDSFHNRRLDILSNICALKRSFYSRSCETKVPLQRTDSTKDGLAELAALLFTEGRVEGKGEIIGQPNRKLNRVESITQHDYFCNKPEKPGRSLSKQSSLVENNNASFSMTLAEQICQKLENHSRLMNNKRRILRRGSSFDNNSAEAPSPSPSPTPSIFQRQSSQSSHSEISKHNGVGVSPKYTENEDPWQKMRPENLSRKSGGPSPNPPVPKSILKEEKSRGMKLKAKTFNQDSSGELMMSNCTAIAEQKVVPVPRKKILKRSSKIELEPQMDSLDINSGNDFQREPKVQESSLSNQDDGSCSKVASLGPGIAAQNGSVKKKTKPILKRSEHFEISVDKNALLRQSESVKKVLNQDLNICGKLLQIQTYNDISFDSSFKPVHR